MCAVQRARDAGGVGGAMYATILQNAVTTILALTLRSCSFSYNKAETVCLCCCKLELQVHTAHTQPNSCAASM